MILFSIKIFITILLIIPLMVCTNNNKRPSGLYIDNDQEQTIIQHILTKNEKILIENELLNLFGIYKKPKSIKSINKKFKTPSFLFDIYNKEILINNNNNDYYDNSIINESDSIIAFKNIGKHKYF